MTQQLFAKQAFASALSLAFGVDVKPEAVSVSFMSDEVLQCLVVRPGGVAEGTFHGDEDGDMVHIESIGQKRCANTYWFEACTDGTAVPIEAILAFTPREEDRTIQVLELEAA